MTAAQVGHYWHPERALKTKDPGALCGRLSLRMERSVQCPCVLGEFAPFLALPLWPPSALDEALRLNGPNVVATEMRTAPKDGETARAPL